MLEDYEINTNTLILLPFDKNFTKVIEKGNIFYIAKKTTEIIDHSCKYFGSSLKGRAAGTKSMLGYSYKLPIIVEESSKIIFFPTCSPEDKLCAWISLKNIFSYEKYNYNSRVTFSNKEKAILDISINTLENQILRATRLESVYKSRKLKQII